jgi:pilus assembly protein CpaB
MRPIQLVILLVAFVAAGAAGMIAMNLAKRPAPAGSPVAAVQTVPTEEVLVAAGDIKVGAAITPETLVWTQWPAGAMPQGFITRRERPDAVTELQGTLARAPILSGEPIRDAKLVRSDRGFLSAVLPKGMRAVAVRVNAASTAGGFILPNDRVDVLLVRQVNGASGSEAQSETILTNIRVLAIDQTIEGDDTEQKPVVVAQDTATLELTPEQVELVTQAQQVGTISLALRSIEDSTTESAVVEKPTGINVVKFGISSRVNARQVQ